MEKLNVIKEDSCPICGGRLEQYNEYDLVFHCDTCDYEKDNN